MILNIISEELTRNYNDDGAKEYICYLINGCKNKRLYMLKITKNLRGQRNVRYHERILSNKKKSNNLYVLF